LNKSVQIKEGQRKGRHTFQIVINRDAIHVPEEPRKVVKPAAKKITELSSSSSSEKLDESPSDMTSQEPSDGSKDSSPKPKKSKDGD
jgi:hypothetical protein